MSDKSESFRCLNCDRTEAVVPLVSLRYSGQQAWICSQCLPVLIHEPGQLAGRLANAAMLTPELPEDR